MDGEKLYIGVTVYKIWYETKGMRNRVITEGRRKKPRSPHTVLQISITASRVTAASRYGNNDLL